jgi:ribose/xylose/arabinose/galactoside ABC-type transport system permease subunit
MATVLICGFVGFINGLIVVYAGITPFIATLAMLSIIEGFSYIIPTGHFAHALNRLERKAKSPITQIFTDLGMRTVTFEAVESHAREERLRCRNPNPFQICEICG